MAIPVDVLILGGGIQGLALLRELSGEYSTLLVGDDLRFSETLHFHGYFSSGWNASNLEAARVYRRASTDWAARLQSYGVSPQQTSFHAALPPTLVDALRSNWEQAGIVAVEEAFPAPFDLAGLPDHRVFRFAQDLVFDGAAAVEQFREPVAERTRLGRAVGWERVGDKITRVDVQVGEELLQVEPGVVLAACGGGNAKVLKQLEVPAEQVRNCQFVRPLHMVLARGPRVPQVSGFLLDLVVVYHPFDEHEGLWIVTLNPSEPKFTPGVIDMAKEPPIEPDLVQASLRKLAAVVPDFAALAEDCLWDVFVGWKTDAPGPDSGALLSLDYPVPYAINSFGIENFLAVWPNHWCLATAAAEDVRRKVQPILPHKHEQPQLPHAPKLPDDARRDKWARSDRPWQSWSQFAKLYNY